jgi:hypothetical protein
MKIARNAIFDLRKAGCRALAPFPAGRYRRAAIPPSCERAASLYSLIGTAKLNGLDLVFYLRTVLTTIAEHPINQIVELLPWNIAASLKTDSSLALRPTHHVSCDTGKICPIPVEHPAPCPRNSVCSST